MKRLSAFIMLCLLAGTVQSCAHSDSLIDQRMKELVRLNGKGTDAALRKRLLTMGTRDQQVRETFYTMFAQDAKPADVEAVNRKVAETDLELTRELKDIVTQSGWPTIRLVGAEASSAATIMLVHSPDKDFQRRMLPELEALFAKDQIVGSDLAVLIDNLLLEDGKPQRFGTKFEIVNGEAVLNPIDDPDPKRLDELRARYMLPSVEEFKKGFGEAFHVTAK